MQEARAQSTQSLPHTGSVRARTLQLPPNQEQWALDVEVNAQGFESRGNVRASWRARGGEMRVEGSGRWFDVVAEAGA